LELSLALSEEDVRLPIATGVGLADVRNNLEVYGPDAQGLMPGQYDFQGVLEILVRDQDD